VQLSNATTVFQADPKVAVTTGGNCVFVWQYGSSPNQVAMQRLSPTGVKQWGNDPILISGPTGEHRWRPSVVASDSGSAILLYAGFTGSTISPQGYKLLTQKVSSTGTTIWADTVYALGNVAGFFVPKIFSDGNNGAIYVWHDQRSGANSTSYVQRFTAAGARLFPVNGSASSTLSGRLHNDAWAAFDRATGDAYLFWYETDAAFQNVYGVYGQRFSPTGARQWPDSGVAFKPLTPTAQPAFVRCFAKDSSAVVFYLQLVGTTTHVVKGFRTNRNGNLLWGGAIKDISSFVSGKGRLTGVLTAAGNSIVTWADNRQDGNGVYAQEISFSGQLGSTTAVEEITERVPTEFALEQNYPNPFNPTTRIAFSIESAKGRTGEPARVTLTVHDVLGREVATLVNASLNPGKYAITFDASKLSSGVYFYQLRAGGFVSTRKMILAK
jgi:hypothetical protein